MELCEGSVRLRLDVAYDGTAFAGWAKQADGLRTVEGDLEAAIATACGRAEGPRPRLVVAGRTDAGVHATGQVAHVDVTEAQLAALTRRNDGARDTGVVARRLTGLLAGRGDAVVQRAVIAPPGFDARFGALHRRYEYRIEDRLSARDPLERHRTLSYPRELDDAAMRWAAAGLLGLHDFGAFCRPREGATTIRELQHLDWTRRSDGVLIADVRADAFCHGMVRALVGASIAIGIGRLAPERLHGLLAAPVRQDAFTVAPAHGLTLVEVGYPPDAGLLEQSRRSRALRESPAV